MTIPVRSIALAACVALAGCSASEPSAPPSQADPAPIAASTPQETTTVSTQNPTTGGLERVEKTPDQWRQLLTPMQYHVTREAGTERAFTGEYWNTKTEGTYLCVCCGQPLFNSDTKFDSGCGWPSFFKPLPGAKISEIVDRSHGMVRMEVRCSRCDAHLGHVFEDGPPPTGLRYCINSASLRLNPDSPVAKGEQSPAE